MPARSSSASIRIRSMSRSGPAVLPRSCGTFNISQALRSWFPCREHPDNQDGRVPTAADPLTRRQQAPRPGEAGVGGVGPAKAIAMRLVVH